MFYLYALYALYADYTDDGRIYYCGKGLEPRVKYKHRSVKHDRIAAKHGWHRRVLVCDEDEDVIHMLEVELIAYRKLNVNRYPENRLACNFTDGGEGTSGHVPEYTDEWRQKQSNAAKKRWQRFRDEGGSLGPYAPERRQKMAAGMTGKKRSPEACANVSRAQLGKKLSEEHKRKIGEKSRAAHARKKAAREGGSSD